MATYSRYHPGQKSCWIDWETTGADFAPGLEGTFKKYQGISFGVVIADNVTFEELDSLYVELKFDDTKYQWTDGAENIHKLSREYLAENGVEREDGLAQLIEILIKHFGESVISFGDTEPTSKVCIGGHNVDFDIKATEQLFKDFGFNLGVHHVKLETSGASFIAIGEYKSNTVFEFFNGGGQRGTHNALEDARLALGAARGIKQLVQAALSA
jgi:hypothetical protein